MCSVAPGPLWADGTVITKVDVPPAPAVPPRHERPVVVDWFRYVPPGKSWAALPKAVPVRVAAATAAMMKVKILLVTLSLKARRPGRAYPVRGSFVRIPRKSDHQSPYGSYAERGELRGERCCGHSLTGS